MTVAVAPVPRQREMADYAAPADSSAVRRPSYRQALLVLAIIGAGAALRLWQLRTSSAWQWDEAVYYRIAANLQQHGVLREHSVLDAPTQPFLYQPPFYLWLLSKWFSAVGASILHARILGVILTAAMQIVLFRLLWKLHGYVIALFVIVPVVFDGWLIYIERVSFIENALMVLLVVALLALSTRSRTAIVSAVRHRRIGGRSGDRLQADGRLRGVGGLAVLADHPTEPSPASGSPRCNHRGHRGVHRRHDGDLQQAGPSVLHRPVTAPDPTDPRAPEQRRNAHVARCRPASVVQPVPLLHSQCRRRRRGARDCCPADLAVLPGA